MSFSRSIQSRINGAKSRGPRTPQGKARFRRRIRRAPDPDQALTEGSPNARPPGKIEVADEAEAMIDDGAMDQAPPATGSSARSACSTNATEDLKAR